MFTRIMGIGVEFTFHIDGSVTGEFSEQAWVDAHGDGYADTYVINGESITYLLPFELRSTYAQSNGQLFSLIAAMADAAGSFINGSNDDPIANALMIRALRRASVHNRSWDGRDTLLDDPYDALGDPLNG